MRKWLLAACALACVMGAEAPAVAQLANDAGLCAGVVSPQVSALLAQFPGGGPALRAAVAQLVEAFPSLADQLVLLARNANSAQKEAIGAGLADAANFFAKCGSDFCRGAESRVRTAMNCADAGTRVGFILGEAPTLAQGIPGFNNAGATTNGCLRGTGPQVISPSSPSQSGASNC
jgi:hypothetical protein